MDVLEATQEPEEAAQVGERVLVLNRAVRRRLVVLERRKRGLRRRFGTSLWLPRFSTPRQSEHQDSDEGKGDDRG